MNVRFRQIPSQTAAMNGKNNSCSLCYGFIFNLLVALCTIGFLCYFLYRFDQRLVSLERKLWNKEHGDGSLSSKERIGSYGQASQHKQAILMRKARTGGKVRLPEAKQLKKLITEEQSRTWSNSSHFREISGQVRQSHSKEFMNTYGSHTVQFTSSWGCVFRRKDKRQKRACDAHGNSKNWRQKRYKAIKLIVHLWRDDDTWYQAI